MKLIDLNTYNVISTFEHDQLLCNTNISRAGFSSNGKYAAVGSKNGSLIIMNVNANGLELEEIYKEHVDNVIAVDWAPEGNRLASIDTGGLLMIWE